MAKLVTTNLDSLENQTSAIQAINANFAAVEAALENTVSRDGTSPNFLTSELDLNNKEILNLGAPTSSSSAARLIDLQSAVTLTGYVIPSIIGNAGKILTTDETSVFWTATGTGDVLAANNGSEFTDKSLFRFNIGLGDAATKNVGTSGSAVPLLNANLSWSGTQNYSGTVTFASAVNLTGAEDVRLTKSSRTSIADDSIGYLGAPQNVQDANYTLTLDDAGKGLTHTSGSAHAWTVPPNSAVAFPIHTTIVFDNLGAGLVTVTRGAGVTIRTNGSSTSADQTLAQYFMRTLYKVDTNTWMWI